MHESYRYSTVLDAPLSAAWAAVRAFASVADWNPVVTASTLEPGVPEQAVGSVRRLQATDGNTYRERLLAVSDLEHTLSYEMLEPPLPTTRLVNTIRLAAVTDGDRTFAEYASRFDVSDEASAAAIANLNAAVFEASLRGLERFLGTRPTDR